MDLESQRIFKELTKAIRTDSQDRLIDALFEAGVLVAVLGPLESLMHWYLAKPRPDVELSGIFAAVSLGVGALLIVLGYVCSSVKERA